MKINEKVLKILTNINYLPLELSNAWTGLGQPDLQILCEHVLGQAEPKFHRDVQA